VCCTVCQSGQILRFNGYIVDRLSDLGAVSVMLEGSKLSDDKISDDSLFASALIATINFIVSLEDRLDVLIFVSPGQQGSLIGARVRRVVTELFQRVKASRKVVVVEESGVESLLKGSELKEVALIDQRPLGGSEEARVGDEVSFTSLSHLFVCFLFVPQRSTSSVGSANEAQGV